jgi:serine/threonine-protein kinase RsbW
MSQSPLLGEAEFRLDGDLNELSRLSARVADFCRTRSLGETAELHLNLVLEELFANAVTHGGCRGVKEAVRVRLAHEAEGLVAIDFSDAGAAFDPASAPAPDLEAPLRERGAGGLGLHFVRSLARIVEYHREDGWNHLKLRLTEAK